MIAKETFTLTQEAVKLNFEGYGFKLCVPKNCLPTQVSETQLSVQVSLSGPFQMPSNCELVSAVYWVSSPHKFKKPVTVEIQHCAALSSYKQCSQLTFVHTKCTQKELPYIFKQRVGGVFTPHSSYGSLSLSHFSGVGIVIRPLVQMFFRFQPLLPASWQTIDSELGQRQQSSESSGQAIDSQQQQQQSSESSGQAIDSQQQQQQLSESSGHAIDSQQQQQQSSESSGHASDSQQQQQQSSESSGHASDSQQQQQSSESSGQASDSQQQQQQQQSLTQSETAYQTGQGEEKGVVEQYCAQLYIARKSANKWKVDFVVTKDLDSCSTVSTKHAVHAYSIHFLICAYFIQVVKKEYSSHGRPQFSFIFSFEEDYVSLTIPENGEVGGWKISSCYNPKVSY